ncbi:MAG: oligosaccharide flippase family protein [Candidatus Eisenbacteria bacterium]|nr:oligosaccharide flippase family protein [Candidatus Eisenbacteria bacterium]
MDRRLLRDVRGTGLREWGNRDHQLPAIRNRTHPSHRDVRGVLAPRAQPPALRQPPDRSDPGFHCEHGYLRSAGQDRRICDPQTSHRSAPAVRRELFSYGGLALIGQVGELLWVATDTMLIGRLFGPAEITLFSFGARWMPLLRQSWTSILRSIQPLFTKLEAEQTTDRSRRATEQTVALSAGVSVPACLVPCVVGKIFLVHWVGVEYTSAYPIILITLIPLSLELTLYPIWVVLAARGRIGWVSVAELVLATTRIGASLFLAVGLSQGILGFAWASAGALLARNLLIRPLATRDLDALPSTYRLLLSYLRAVAGAAPALILLWLAQPLYRDSLAAVVIAGMLGGALALAGAITASFGRSGLLRLRKGIMSRA